MMLCAVVVVVWNRSTVPLVAKWKSCKQTGAQDVFQPAPGNRLKPFSYGITPSVGDSVDRMCNDVHAGLQEGFLSLQERSNRQEIAASNNCYNCVP